jgi:hypothetical protein
MLLLPHSFSAAAAAAVTQCRVFVATTVGRREQQLAGRDYSGHREREREREKQTNKQGGEERLQEAVEEGGQ